MRAILIPSKFEAKLLLRKLTSKLHYKVDDIDCYLGEFGDKTVTVAIIGMGKPHAIWRTDKFIRKTGPADVVLAGFAGALNPHLEHGDIIIDRNNTRTVTVDKVVSSAHEKAGIFEQTHREVVDMESRYIAEIANNYHLKCTVIRAVSDLATENVPNHILKMGYDQDSGSFTPIKLLWHLLTHPSQIKPFRRFLSPLGRVRQRLTNAVISYVETTPEPKLLDARAVEE